ncbi:MAG: ribbon-helix-helix domain-containing protein [Candidatus Thermoplasmatota archaeon]
MAAKTVKQPTDRITVRLPKSQLQQMEALVQAGVYRNTTDLVFNAVKELLLVKGTAAKQTIEAERGMLELQQAMAAIDAAKRKLGMR